MAPVAGRRGAAGEPGQERVVGKMERPDGDFSLIHAPLMTHFWIHLGEAHAWQE